jgi:site-specific DNA recombinase
MIIIIRTGVVVMNIRAAAYIRYSSENQRDESLDAQLREIETYCKNNGYEIVKVYADKAKTATSDRRQEFQAMIKDSSTGLFNVVLVHKLDRFSRDKYDSATYKRKLKKNGVRLISITERIDGSPESIILESVIEGMAEYYSKNLAREVMKGMTENALKCKHTGGIAPLGYDVHPDTKKLVVNNAEAPIVKMIFRMYADGYSYQDIVKELNKNSYKTKVNTPFGKTGLNSILTNEKYTGVYIYNKRVSKDFEGKVNASKSKNEDEIIKIAGGCPALVSKEDYLKVQERLKENKRKGGSFKAKEIYLLTGVITCGSCGYAMYGNRRRDGKKKDKIYSSYKCGHKSNKFSCNNKEIRKEVLEEYVLFELETNLFNNTQTIVEKLNEHIKNKAMEVQYEIRVLQDKVSELSQKITNLINAISKIGNLTVSLADEIAKMEDEKSQMLNRIYILEKRKSGNAVTPESMSTLLSKFHKYVLERNIPECKKFIHHFVNKVVVFQDRVEITFTVDSIDVPNEEPLTITSNADKEAILDNSKYAI